ncbi:MAG: DUF1428 domain-containing protein [Verrucomicrobia bacterium]|nr:DUF1428 domain-containing protein [Verrucomicrobiota bacterium]
MAQYVDGYLLPIPKKNLAAYRTLARRVARIFLDHGALEVRECAGEDLESRWGKTFGQNLKLKSDEVAIYSWIVFRSRAQRDRTNELVQEDARMKKLASGTMLFDCKRMVYGGFTTLVLARRS